METMGLVIGQQCKIFADLYNENRLERAERRSSEDVFKEEEGILYGPEIAD